ncbi:TetR family transcriptional regulator [Azorhizobium oxalatiphilum]|uniref:TetR family transcriptional regulator n=1 Tax=Azorhizobium oxalatiphilum TaxID=980631 RepID=A0A917FG92_9HYPH|nr:TetR/AcrR family transcriptional regulator [Azorhizobium oxalatiphilum]GGF79416.1 TetR family transcriptional regulator [Azorhizobium oxalatiphilum]
MARPRSDERRNAILTAAIRVIATEGTGAATAKIAKAAEVSNGSLFTYFETKADLLNALYLELKGEMATLAVAGLPTGGEPRDQLQRLWSNWLHWARFNPEKRRAMAHLSVSEELTQQTRDAASRTMPEVVRLLEECRNRGSMRDVPMTFVMALIAAMAEATIDFMIQDPAQAEAHCSSGFDAVWRMLA